MKVQYKQFSLPFVHPFTISRGTKTHQPTLVVALEHLGITGYGEAPAISYYDIPVEKMIADLEGRRAMLEKYAFTDPERFWHFLHHLFPKNSFLVCALDIAGWDLYGKMRQQPLYKLWGTNIEKIPVTDYTVGIDTINKMVEKMQEKPWPIYKIKLGTKDDIDIMRALRKHTDAILRVDANSGWELDEAIEKIPILQELGVEFVEQPLHKDNWEDMKILYEKSALPLFADESCVAEHDVEKCAGHFHGINIKLTKCGGLTPARRMITKGRELGMQIMIGSMNESTVGTAAIAHLLPSIDHVDMDGPLLLAEDLATGISFVNGKATFSGKPGLGVTPNFSF
jgi:L-alanine-DL-glutamate epimerase-like enolase superfamily enzyme